MSLVTVEIHLKTGLQFGPSWIRKISRSFSVRLISNVETDNFGTPQYSQNLSNSLISSSQNRLESRNHSWIGKNHVLIIGTVKGQSVLYFRSRTLTKSTQRVYAIHFRRWYFSFKFSNILSF